ncbi:coiled-coil domain-containing protein 86 [Lutzomyia longipalpis]|uniref:coiled-coil domain-containing protein 86 n=1 Tax=Lutzomyia longipalpis TaxID=7200 RepID=UPI0024834385|nr:coiled-coil domain-containing protein 86 [Lutzomyia longipalpis]
MGRTKKSPMKRMETSQEENTEKMVTEATSNPPVESSSSDSKTTDKSATGKKKAAASLPRGIPKSGRVWKTQKQKFSTIKKSLNRGSFEKKEQLRQEIKQIKELSRSIKEQKKQEKEQLKQRREENERRKLENQQKSEIVQIIKNPAKLKRIRKKQLRMIEKRDLSKVKAI